MQGAHLLFAQAGNADGPQGFFVAQVEVGEQGDGQFAAVGLVGLAIAVEGFGGDDDALSLDGEELAMEFVTEATRFLGHRDAVLEGGEFADQFDDVLALPLAKVDRKGLI